MVSPLSQRTYTALELHYTSCPVQSSERMQLNMKYVLFVEWQFFALTMALEVVMHWVVGTMQPAMKGKEAVKNTWENKLRLAL